MYLLDPPLIGPGSNTPSVHTEQMASKLCLNKAAMQNVQVNGTRFKSVVNWAPGEPGTEPHGPRGTAPWSPRGRRLRLRNPDLQLQNNKLFSEEKILICARDTKRHHHPKMSLSEIKLIYFEKQQPANFSLLMFVRTGNGIRKCFSFGSFRSFCGW